MLKIASFLTIRKVTSSKQLINQRIRPHLSSHLPLFPPWQYPHPNNNPHARHLTKLSQLYYREYPNTLAEAQQLPSCQKHLDNCYPGLVFTITRHRQVNCPQETREETSGKGRYWIVFRIFERHALLTREKALNGNIALRVCLVLIGEACQPSLTSTITKMLMKPHSPLKIPFGQERHHNAT